MNCFTDLRICIGQNRRKLSVFMTKTVTRAGTKVGGAKLCQGRRDARAPPSALDQGDGSEGELGAGSDGDSAAKAHGDGTQLDRRLPGPQRNAARAQLRLEDRS